MKLQPEVTLCTRCRLSVHTENIETPYCPRCHSKLNKRVPYSFQKTLALTLTALILYFPANFYPIMIIEKLNGQRADTIMSGIIVLYQQGLILIASIVFLASIMIPLIKIIALFYLMYSVKFNQTSQKFKTTLAHVIEFIGKWSMLDIYVIAILMAIVNLGFVTKVKTGPASFFFTLVVITTLWASHSFDTRLLWDKKREQDGSSDSNSGA